MAEPDDRPYVIERREVVAETDTLRVSILTLAEGQEVPWHYHTWVTDTFYCLEGALSVETRSPKARHLLDVGESCAVAPMTAHPGHRTGWRTRPLSDRAGSRHLRLLPGRLKHAVPATRRHTPPRSGRE